MPELQTRRLIINPLTDRDAAFMLAILNDPDFIAHVADRGVRTLAQARQYIVEGPMASYREYGFGMLAVRLRENQRVVGLCGLVKRPELEDVDIGYAFLPEARGQGLALEAARAVWDHATGDLGMTRLVAIVAPENSASRRLLEKLGLRHEDDICLQPDAAPICRYGWFAPATPPG